MENADHRLTDQSCLVGMKNRLKERCDGRSGTTRGEVDFDLTSSCISDCRSPEWSLDSISIRQGCIILEVDIVQREGDLRPADLSLADWMKIMKPEDFENVNMDQEDMVYIKVG